MQMPENEGLVVVGHLSERVLFVWDVGSVGMLLRTGGVIFFVELWAGRV